MKDVERVDGLQEEHHTLVNTPTYVLYTLTYTDGRVTARKGRLLSTLLTLLLLMYILISNNTFFNITSDLGGFENLTAVLQEGNEQVRLTY